MAPNRIGAATNGIFDAEEPAQGEAELYDLIIRDATIIRSGGRRVADIAVEDGRIAYVGGNAAGRAREEIQGIGRFVMPGVIDSHVHFRKVGAYDQDDWESNSRMALRTGVTTILDMPDSASPTIDEKSLDERLAAAEAGCHADFGLWMRATKDNLERLPELQANGKVAATLARLDVDEGDLAFGVEELEQLMSSGTGLIGVHAESAKALAKYRRKWAAVEDPVHNDVRPPKAALEATKQVLELVRKTGRATHLVSLSTANELNHLDPYRDDVPLSVQVHPYHLFLSVETSSSQGDAIKVDPPVRAELDRRALWAAVKRGRVDMFASGHAPLSLDQKKSPYWDVPSGIPGVGTLFPLLMSAVKHGRLGLERMAEMCCEAPARVFGLENKGEIQVGYDADLVLFTEGETSRLKKAPPSATSGWTPYIGREVGLDPVVVVRGGQIVARNGVLEEDLSAGRRIQVSQG